MAPPQSDIDAGREKLIDIVLDLIEARGGEAVTVSEVAARAGMSPANLSRYFESKEAMVEAVAGRWFQPMVVMMEEVVASDLPPRRKMYEFFARRFVYLRGEYNRDPVAFANYCELGHEHFEDVRSYIDLADHYLGEIIGEAMADGHFAGLDVDMAISLVNQIVHAYCNINVMLYLMDRLSEEKLARIIDTVFDGLSAQDRGARATTGLRAA